MRLSGIRMIGRYVNPETGRPVNVHKGRNIARGTGHLFFIRSGERVYIDDAAFYSQTEWNKHDPQTMAAVTSSALLVDRMKDKVAFGPDAFYLGRVELAHLLVMSELAGIKFTDQKVIDPGDKRAEFMSVPVFLVNAESHFRAVRYGANER